MDSSDASSDARRVLLNFILMSVLFSANHGCVVACLALATSQLGSLGAWQSGVLYIAYTGSALAGATLIVKQLGPRNAMMAGMAAYITYVGCFWLATRWSQGARETALFGAAIGGVGAGFLWTAQGSYFARAAEEHATVLNQPVARSTAKLAGIFAFVYLAEEVALRALSTVLLRVAGLQWSVVFAIYSSVTVTSTLLMVFVKIYVPADDAQELTSPWLKITAAAHLLLQDPKMKYMIGMNAVFGFSSAFVNSYVNGEVVRIVLRDQNSTYLGVLTAWSSVVAAAMSLVFGRWAERVDKGKILTQGALCFLLVALPFLAMPNLRHWSWATLVLVYAFQGTGRATFEGTLKATFADYFSYEKEGAFANIILQNGLASAIGYILTFGLPCAAPSTYCVQYKDGSLHNVLIFELLIILTALLAVAGYWRAAALHASTTSALSTDVHDAAVDLLPVEGNTEQ